MNTTEKKLISLFETLPLGGYPKEWVGYSELLKHLTVAEVKKYVKKDYIESNHGDYDWGEPSFRLIIKTNNT